ncbi:hypothetical protein JCM8097_008648 [Rhodosporidiobolus ruineniae]
MLGRVPELSLIVADSLDTPSLASLSLVSRTLHKLVQPVLYRHVNLSVGNPWGDNDGEKAHELSGRVQDKVESLLAGNEDRLKLVKRLTVVGCGWSDSEEGLKKLDELLRKVKVEELDLLHCPIHKPKLDPWSPLWHALAAQPQIHTLRIVGNPAPLQPYGGEGGVYLPQSWYNSVFDLHKFAQHSPTSLRSLSLSSLWFSSEDEDEDQDGDEGEDEAKPSPFPSTVFTGLEELLLEDLTSDFLEAVAVSFKACSKSNSALPLRAVTLDSHMQCDAASSYNPVKADLLDFLTAFSAAPHLSSLAIGSTGSASHRGIAQMLVMSSGVPFGMPIAAVFDAEDVRELASTVASELTGLTELTLRLNPRAEGWYEKLAEEDLIEFAQTVGTMPNLRRFTTNAILPLPAASSAADEDAKPAPPSATHLDRTAQLLLAPLPTLDSLTLADELEVVQDSFDETTLGEPEEAAARRATQTWRRSADSRAGEV